MNLRKVIKQTLNEVAGISFEVRQWAQILSSEIDRLVSEADEAEASKQGDTEPEKEEPVYSHATTYDESDSDFITHFEDLGGNAYDEVVVPGEELMYDAETIKDFPEISNIVKHKTIQVSVEDWGYQVDFVEGGMDPQYEEVIEDMVLDHAQWGQTFYDYHSYNECMAVFEGDGVEEETSEPWWRTGSSYWGSYKPTPRAEINELVIDGKDFPEAYDKFSVDKWIFRQASRIEYDHYKSGYNDNGEYEAIFNVPIRGLSMGMFVHEIKHAYDDWNRMRHGGKPIRDSWEIKNIYTKDFERMILGGASKFPQLGPIVRMYYLGSKLETPAYLENEYDSPTAQSYRTTAKKLMNFDMGRFFNKKGRPAKGLEEEFQTLTREYDIPYFRKFKDVRSFLGATQKYFNKRGRDIIKRIDKALYVHGKRTSSEPQRSYTIHPPKDKPKSSGAGEQLSLPF
jgi:hypothetical protein